MDAWPARSEAAFDAYVESLTEVIGTPIGRSH